MDKKVLALTLVLMAIPLLTVLPVQAGKGTEKLYFKLYMEGITVGPPDRVWTSDDVVHVRGLPWVVIGAFEVYIGEDPPILLTPADYSGSLDINGNEKTGQLTLTVHETITVAGGTLEIMSVDKMYNYGTPDVYGEGTFVGHGTGALEGVKVAGTTSAEVPVPGVNWITREGTVMGWP